LVGSGIVAGVVVVCGIVASEIVGAGVYVGVAGGVDDGPGVGEQGQVAAGPGVMSAAAVAEGTGNAVGARVAGAVDVAVTDTVAGGLPGPLMASSVIDMVALAGRSSVGVAEAEAVAVCVLAWPMAGLVMVTVVPSWASGVGVPVAEVDVAARFCGLQVSEASGVSVAGGTTASVVLTFGIALVSGVARKIAEPGRVPAVSPPAEGT
jgi:hypothetical protein